MEVHHCLQSLGVSYSGDGHDGIFNGNLIVKKNKYFFLSTTYQDFALVAINPHPGDDIQIQFKIGAAAVTNLSDAPRLAVYDKKELWRANLYIDDTKTGNDWNDQHPWIGELQANGTPDPNGANFNQWNYTFDGTNFQVSTGGQTLSFHSSNQYTPVRPQSGGAGNSTDVANSVAYEYPDGTLVNLAFDSPFDFYYKMHEQQLDTQNEYKNDPNFSNLASSANVSLSSGQLIALETVKTWSSFLAPGKYWENYQRDLLPDDSSVNYLPGLGLLNHTLVDAEPEINLQFVQGLGAKQANLYGCGTDCLGFVARAVGYQGEAYEWGNLPGKDSAEQGSIALNADGSLNQGARNVSYPDSTNSCLDIASNGSANTSWSASNMAADFPPTLAGDTGQASASLIAKYKTLVPGDIVIINPGTHIGIIDSVDPIYDGMTYQQLENATHIIDSTYWGPVNYVTTDLDNGGITTFVTEWRQTPDQTALNNWVIVRLK